MSWVAVERAIRIAPPARPARRPRALGERARRDLRPDHGARLERAAAGVRAALRLGRARRLRAADAAREVRRARPTRAGSRRSTRSSKELVSDSLVYRYNAEASPDGLEGEEGTFSICSFWYVEALARAGRLDEARLAFEKMLTYANHLGLYSEEIGPHRRAARELPAGVHAPRADQRRVQPRPRARLTGRGGAVHLTTETPEPEAAPGTITFLDAIRSALRDALLDDRRVFLLGEDIGHFGGAFGVTKGLLGGVRRRPGGSIRRSPRRGSSALRSGAAWQGERPVVELQFADFASCAFDQIVTVGAKMHWRSGIALPVVIRAPFGGGVRGGPSMPSCPEGWFAGTAGLKVVAPATVADAYGLLRTAIDDDDPVALLRAQGALPAAARRGRPSRVTGCRFGGRASPGRGVDATVVTYGRGASTLALRATVGPRRRGRRPPDALAARRAWMTRVRSRRRRALLVLQEASRSTGVAGLVLSLIAREAFEGLDAPPALVAAPGHTGPVRTRARGRLPAVGRGRPRGGGGAPCLLRSASSCFAGMLLQRLVEERILALYRQGRISDFLFQNFMLQL